MKKRVVITVIFIVVCCAAVLGIYFLSLPKAAKSEKESIARGSNEFALELYARLGEETDGNLFFSPFSISTALAMVYVGAREDTEAQMKEVLHFDLDQERLHPSYAALMRELRSASGKRGSELVLANSLWGQRGYEFERSFQKKTRKYYGAGFRIVDFVEAREKARGEINQWVKDKTRRMIEEIIGQGVIDDMTRLIVVNAIYFNGAWESKFWPQRTHAEPFYLLSGEEIQVPMMSQKGEFRYMEGDDLKVLELTYVGGRLAMTIFLPDERDGILELDRSFTIDKMQEWIGRLSTTEIEIQIPKFKMTSDFKLSKVLICMGMEDAFDEGKADLTGIAPATEEQLDLFIKEVLHEAWVEVNEEGTRASAATAAVLEEKSAPFYEFIADHPFLFVIRDKKTGCLLFIGRVMDPR